MSLTIELQPEVEAELRQEAAKLGMDAGAFAARTLSERFRKAARSGSRGRKESDVSEVELLKRINRGWPERKWTRYEELIGKRRAETLTESEHSELVALGDDLERWNVRRLTHLSRLAALRQTTVRALMAELGIHPRNV